MSASAACTCCYFTGNSCQGVRSHCDSATSGRVAHAETFGRDVVVIAGRRQHSILSGRLGHLTAVSVLMKQTQQGNLLAVIIRVLRCVNSRRSEALSVPVRVTCRLCARSWPVRRLRVLAWQKVVHRRKSACSIKLHVDYWPSA